MTATEYMTKIKLYPIPCSPQPLTPELVAKLQPYFCETQTHSFLISAHGILELKPNGSMVQQLIHDGHSVTLAPNPTALQQQQFLLDTSTITDGSIVYQVDPDHHLEQLKRSIYKLSSTCHIIIIETLNLGPSTTRQSHLYLELDDTSWPTFTTSPLYSTFLSLVK
jgi:hypothetical protein